MLISIMIILRNKNVDSPSLEMRLSFCFYLLCSLHNVMRGVLQDSPSQVGESNTHVTTVPDRISLGMLVGRLSCMQIQCPIASLCVT